MAGSIATWTSRPSVSTRSAPYFSSRYLRTASAYQAPGGSSERFATSTGFASSASACFWEMNPSSTIRRSTYLCRSFAARGCFAGESRSGDCTRPAIMAASPMESFWTLFPK